MHPDLHTDLDNLDSVENNLRHSAKGSLDAYDVTFSLTEAVRAVLSMQWSSEESHDDRCQESTLESALQGGRLHRVTTRSRSRAGSVSAWEDFYAEVMEEAGFRRGVGCSVIFVHEEKDLLGVVHGDDFVFGGNDEDLKWVAKVLAAKFVIKVRAVLGPEDEDQEDEVLFVRFVRWKGLGN